MDRSPEETSRRLCLGFLAEADQSLGRLEAGDEGEALHDFRVALRRLRSALRAYRRYLAGSRPKKLRRLVGALASSTNRARDVEVQIAWLETEGSVAAATLRAQLAAGTQALPSPARLRKEFDTAAKTARATLRRVRLSDDTDGQSYVAATGGLLLERGAVVEAGLSAVASAAEAERLHRLRIEAKRLRYLLEPLQAQVRGVRTLIKKMKGLQDCLGELQDTRVLTETIAELLERAAVREARRLRDRALGRVESESETETPSDAEGSSSAGLYELLEKQKARRDRGFAELMDTWLGEAGAAFFAELRRLAARLESPARRLFLLTALPEPVSGTVPTVVRRGWLPGKSLSICLRSEQRGRRTRYVQGVAVGGRVVEEPLRRASFETLWPLTEDRRLEHQRYEVGSCTIDVIEDKGVALALAGVDVVPDWLQPWVVRDVTGVKRFTFESLARARSAPERPVDPPAGAP